MKLSSADRRKILTEMQLATMLFNTKRWAERFHISPRQVKRLRAETKRLVAPKGPFHVEIKVSNNLSSEPPAGPNKQVKT